ncbi:transposon Tf2-6 polyprotein [Trichonephila clavipes]|nr:transposon Tf2-6 polyprotein [Trichonephila clavipes]
MRALQPIPTSAHSNSSMFVPTKLKSCSHVFLRIDSVQPPLSQNCTGPHKVIRRTDKVFTILINGKRKAVSIDRVKPAYVWDDTDPQKRQYLKKKPIVRNKSVPDQQAGPSNPAFNNKRQLPSEPPKVVNKRPKKGFATAKQRLGKILKIHKMIY